ncbi:unnamed protein product [Pleuronectes platessa]|uniref:Uncharacterized protein n=1 Tax=Pleuronectes platessa TaxID=8262 RepID=A0A9N7ZE88_PLEPL|nr:unnamed protein product [Pleuronectes platessa]
MGGKRRRRRRRRRRKRRRRRRAESIFCQLFSSHRQHSMINQTGVLHDSPPLAPPLSLTGSLPLPDGINAKLRAGENQSSASEAGKARRHSSYLLLFG